MIRAVQYLRHGCGLPFCETTLKLLLVVTLSGIFLTAKAQAPGNTPVLPTYSFNLPFAIDGHVVRQNTAINAPGDWTTTLAQWPAGAVFHPTTGQGSSFPFSLTRHVVDAWGLNDNIFANGAKADDNPTTQWNWTIGSAGDKTDINHALVHLAQDGVGDDWVILAGDRASQNGVSYIDFEFLQAAMTMTAGGGFSSQASNATGGRTPGDFLVTMEYTNGGSIPNILYYTWAISGGTYTWVSFTPAAGNTFIATNALATSVPYGAFGVTTYPANAFVETAINVSSFANIGYLNPCTGLTFQTLFIKTKASNSATAVLKDLIEPIQLSQFNQLTVTATSTPVMCNGGNATITANATGGYGSFTYSLNGGPFQSANTFSVPAGGPYIVTVKDANTCSTSSNAVTLTQPTALVATITGQSNISCFGNATGSATVAATGGTGGYTYSWNTTPVQTTATATGLTAGTYTVTVTDGNSCNTTAQAVITQPASGLSLSAGATVHVSCNGGSNGSATVVASGGTAPYTYSWNTTPAQTTPTATNLAAGTYVVTVTDNNGCTATQSFTITQPATLDAAITAHANVSCFAGSNGSSTVSVTGGTAPYTYSWNSTPVQTTAHAANLPAGTYTVTVTDNKGCTDTAMVIVTQPVQLSASLLAINLSCYNLTNGSIAATVTGGTSPYSYSWNTSPVQTTAAISNLASGTYTLTVTDGNGCNTSATGTVTYPYAPFQASPGAVSHVSCHGGNNGTVGVNISGGVPPYTYSWNTIPAQTTATAAGLAAGTYTVTATDSNGCTAIATVTVTQPAAPLAASITGTIHVGCFGTATGSAAVTVTGGTAPYTYSWNTTPVQTTATATGLPAGTYTVTVTDNNGCVTQQTVTITQPSLLNAAIGSSTNVSCYGGSNGTAAITVSGGTASFTYSWNTTPAQVTSSVNNLPAGTYTITVSDANGCSDTAMVVITQPALLTVTAAATPLSCFNGTDGTATATVNGGATPYAYSWNSSPIQNTPTATALAAGTYTVSITDNNGCTANASAVVHYPYSVLDATAGALTHVSCHGGNNGTANVQVTGGLPPYTYNWSSTPVQTTATATNLSAGTYSVVVTDNNGCKDTVVVTITQPAAALASTTAANPGSCSGIANGSVTVTATGGTAPYTYSWSTVPVQTTAVATNIGAGTYTVTVTDNNGCVTTNTATISAPDPLVAAINASSNPSCFSNANGAATVSATGGTAPYSYSWNTTPVQTTATASNLVAGTYTVTVTDLNGCTATATVTLTEPTLLTASVNASGLPCINSTTGTGTAIVNGGTAPYTYSWNTTPVQTTATATGLSSGTYTVSVTDNNGCAVSASGTIIYAFPPIEATPSVSTPVSCYGGTNGTAGVNVIGGVPPYTYSWNTTSVQTTPTATNLPAGFHIVTVTDSNGCADTAGITVTQPTSAPSASITNTTHVSCFGLADGSAAATATGGTPPYSYSWNTVPVQTTATATGLTAGTYTLTVTDDNGCVTTTVVTINQPATLTPAIATHNDVSCFAGSNGSATVSVTGGTAPYTYSWNTTPVQTTPTASNLVAGTYTVTVTDLNGCTATTTVTLTEPALLTASVNASGLPCINSTTGTVTAIVNGGTAPYTYSWNTTPVQTTATATGLSSGTYTVSVTDNNGCAVSASGTITYAFPPIEATPGASTPVSCYGGANGTAGVNVIGGVPPYFYSWNTTPVQTTPTATNLPAGFHIVTVTDSNGCADTAGITVTQPTSAPSASITNTTHVSCFGLADGSAAATATGGTPPYTYSWNTVPVQTTATATGLTAGTYTLTVTDDNGCVTTTAVTITQPPTLNPAIGASSNVSCFGGSNGTATVAVIGGTAPYTYSWNTTPVQTTATATNLSAGTYSVTVVDTNGCTASVSVTITEPALLTVATNMSHPLCFGHNGSGLAVATGGTAPYSYSWTSTPAQTTAAASNLPPGTYSVTVTDAQGCTATATDSVNSPPSAVVATITDSSDVYCFGGNNGSASVQASGGTAPYTYSWNTTPVQTGTNATGLTAGTYIITVTDAFGCTGVATVSIGQPAPLVVTPSVVNGTCPGAKEGAATVVMSGGTPPYAISWNTTPVATTPTITGLATGSYTVTITDSLGCTQSAGIGIPQFPSPVVSAGPDKVICPGESVELQATGASFYQWSPGQTLSCISCPNPWANPPDTTVYTVIGVDINGCVDSDAVMVTVRKRGPVSAGSDTTICAGQSVQLFASGGTSYSWISSNGTSVNGSSNPAVSPGDTTEYIVIIRQEPCFADTLKQTINVIANPTVDIGPDYHGLVGSSYQLNAQVTNTVSIWWNPAENLSCNNCYNPTVVLNAPMTIRATVKNELGCEASDEMKITVYCDNSVIFMPNTFTPNGDGNNDLFYPMGGGMRSVEVFRIYDRWGEMVYEARDISPNEMKYGWDGRYKGKQLKPDVYVYYLYGTCLNDYPLFMKGDVSLIR